MGRKLVIAVGKAWTGFDGKSVDPRSRASLTDADIILFRPGLGIKADGVAKDRIKFYQRDTAVEVSDTLKHWRSELATAWENGKMLIVWLEKEDTFHVYDPRGSSRDLTSYYPVPFPHPLKLVESHGKIMHLTPSADALSPYWRKFGHLSEYSVYLTEPVGEPLIVTKGAERTVGALLRNKTGGAILLLPPPDLSEATEEVDAAGLGHQLLEAILAIDQALNPREERTPPPGWSTHESFKLHGETDLLSSIESVRKKLQRLTKQQGAAVGKLDQVMC